jgi:hypothetical protein
MVPLNDIFRDLQQKNLPAIGMCLIPKLLVNVEQYR